MTGHGAEQGVARITEAYERFSNDGAAFEYSLEQMLLLDKARPYLATTPGASIAPHRFYECEQQLPHRLSLRFAASNRAYKARYLMFTLHNGWTSKERGLVLLLAQDPDLMLPNQVDYRTFLVPHGVIGALAWPFSTFRQFQKKSERLFDGLYLTQQEVGRIATHMTQSQKGPLSRRHSIAQDAVAALTPDKTLVA